MKIEIDLDGFMEGSEDGGYRLSDLIKNEIVEKITRNLDNDITTKMNQKIQDILSTTVKDKVETFIDDLLPKLMNHEFTEVTSWGEEKEKFTVKNRILKAFKEQCVYEKTNRYDNSKNKFTELVDSIVAKRLQEFTQEYQKVIDEKFTEACYEEATERLKKQLKVQTR